MIEAVKTFHLVQDTHGYMTTNGNEVTIPRGTVFQFQDVGDTESVKSVRPLTVEDIQKICGVIADFPDIFDAVHDRDAVLDTIVYGNYEIDVDLVGHLVTNLTSVREVDVASRFLEHIIAKEQLKLNYLISRRDTIT